MLTKEGKKQLNDIVVTGNKIGLITNEKVKLIEKELKLFDWEEHFNLLKTVVEFSDFEFTGFIAVGYYLKKDNTIFFSDYFTEEYLIKNKKDLIEIDLRLEIGDCKNE